MYLRLFSTCNSEYKTKDVHTALTIIWVQRAEYDGLDTRV